MANKPLQSIRFPGLSDTYTVPQVDNTLAVTGSAADAKKTGDEITNLKDDLNYYTEESITVYSLLEDYRLDGTGKSINSSRYNMLKYEVTAGDTLHLVLSKDVVGSEAEGVYQWQSVADVPTSLPNPNLVGTPVSDAVNGFVTVPEGTTFLIVSQFKTNTTNSVKLVTEVTTIKEKVDELETKVDSLEPGLSEEAKEALLACFAHVAWIDDDGQDYYDALYEALYEPTPQWLLEWSYLDGATPIAFAPSDWASGYSSNIWSFVSGKGARVALPSSGNDTANLYPKNYETSSNSAYQVKFNFASLPTSGGVFIRLGNGSVGMETLINANGVSIDHGANYLSGITIEANVDYVIKAVRNADGCSLYFNNNLVWTGQSADIGNKKNHILVTVPTGSTDVYFSEIKFNTTDSWDYEWDASSTTLPEGMTADYYDFTRENGAMFVKTPVLDLNYTGNGVLQIEIKAYSETGTGDQIFSINSPQLLIKNETVSENQFRGIKIVLDSALSTSSNHGMSAVSVNGVNALIPSSNSSEYHVYELTAENNVYEVKIDGNPITITQNTNTSPYYVRTGIGTTSVSPGFFGAFIKSIKFKRL